MVLRFIWRTRGACLQTPNASLGIFGRRAHTKIKAQRSKPPRMAEDASENTIHRIGESVAEGGREEKMEKSKDKNPHNNKIQQIKREIRFEAFWDSIDSFPLGVYCEKFEYDWRMENLPMDCATCTYLSIGKCSQGRIPNKRVLK